MPYFLVNVSRTQTRRVKAPDSAKAEEQALAGEGELKSSNTNCNAHLDGDQEESGKKQKP